ncbi:hypothetical protein EZ313_21665 [Ramlibacter henchirensis]|uniref:Uncharacterized protein n=1 Tax=Ramlibacter henchirensis TaxID=204072 RepID=A0A4Z0BIN7_9BURK|nr:hypothetical protein [Ramlibacter henchirensis]TFY99182.1 hypothetical protein EZ313_21665 [Ramlibacter henchirensis]
MAEKKQQGAPGTPVAQDDLLGEAARATGPVEGLDAQVGGDGTPRDRGQAEGESRERSQADGEACPGKDENQAGFVKDREKPDRP